MSKKSKTIEREKKLVLSDFPAVCDGENVSAECPKEGKTLKEGKGGGVEGSGPESPLEVNIPALITYAPWEH